MIVTGPSLDSYVIFIWEYVHAENGKMWLECKGYVLLAERFTSRDVGAKPNFFSDLSKLQ